MNRFWSAAETGQTNRAKRSEWRFSSSVGIQALRLFRPETAHRAALLALKAGLIPRPTPITDPRLALEVFGRRLPHPIGVAAGFDKNAEVTDALFGLGAAHVEIGTVTPRPQPGNQRPRLFRLTEDRAVINRMGFNNDGVAAVRARLERRAERHKLLGVNMGANADSADRAADYEAVLRGLWSCGDFFTVNVSSPNTQGLRGLQEAEALIPLLRRLVAVRAALMEGSGWKPLVVKISPDLSDTDIARIGETAARFGLDGVMAANSTTSRQQHLKSRHAREPGGLSGAPHFARSTEMLKILRRAGGPELTLIGVGGVDSPETAYAKIRAGATLVQLYTAMVFKGPRLLSDIASGLAGLLARDGLAHVSDAVGLDVD
jgi:dihydroorotate dehydrogenase